MPARSSQGLSFSLDWASGVPVYRQIIDQVTSGIASGAVAPGYQLPTVRQLAVDLAVNPNTVVRAYRELEIRGILETQQGTGTFIAKQKIKRDEAQRQKRLSQLVGEFVARAGREGFTVAELMAQLQEYAAEAGQRGKNS
jgi:GntR family transcriptional regulator